MKAMLLSAGVGERMLPLTLSTPKPAIPVLGRPLAVQILRRLAAQGVDLAVLNLHHLPEVIRRMLGDGTESGLPSIAFTHEERILGTAGGIRHAAGLLRGGSPIVICNSDFLADFDLAPAVRAHRSSGCLATLVVVTWRPGYSAVEVDDTGHVLSIAGEPAAPPRKVAGRFLFTGLHLIEEELLDRFPDTVPSSIVSDVYRPLAREGRLGSHLHGGFWWEFGSPELYLEGSLRLLDCPSDRRRAISADHDPVRRVDGAVVAVGAGAVIDDTARFIGHAAIGFASNVGAKARIENSIVMPEAWIGPEARLSRSIVAQAVELPAGFEAEDTLICNDCRRDQPVPVGTERRNGLLLRPLASPRS